MKITKEQMFKKMEEIIGNGIIEMEEIDITAKNMMDLVWPVIEYFRNNN